MPEPTNLRNIPDHADLRTAEKWLESVEDGLFIRSDGTGYWATDKLMDRSADAFSAKPDWATHVAWFNK